MKKIIVTGGLGFIGSNLIDLLLKKNFFVINIDKATYSSNQYNVKEFNNSKKYKFIKLDIKNRKLKINKEEETFFYKNLFKIGYSKKKLLNINRVKYLRELAKAFQRRFRQELVNGKIDRECLLISKNLVGEFK